MAQKRIFECILENEMSSKISIAEFKKRLALLCLKGGGFSQKPRDRNILFKSVISTFDSCRTYTETEVNERLIQWLTLVGRSIELDYVSLRRYLVDAGYLKRDAASQSYCVDLAQTSELFETGVEDVDSVEVLEAAERHTEARKQAHLGQENSDYA